jgi:2-iminobutanoate/2-iminopropanoate deaminase
MVEKEKKAALSAVRRAGDFLFISGQVPTDKDGNIVGESVKEQVTIVMNKIKELLEENSATLEDIVKTTVFLPDISNFTEMNDAYAKFFKNKLPARSAIGAQLAIDINVEIEAVAYCPRK